MTRSTLKISPGQLLTGNADGDAVERSFEHNHSRFPLFVEMYDADKNLMQYNQSLTERSAGGMNILSMFMGSDPDNGIGYAYRDSKIYSQEGSGNGGRIQYIQNTSHVYAMNESSETGTIDAEENISGVNAKYTRSVDSYHESVDTTSLLELVSGLMGYDLHITTSSCIIDLCIELPANQTYMILNGDEGSYAQLGDYNIWLKGSYAPPRYWGSLASAPSSDMIDGDEYYNTGDLKFYKYNGSTWIALN